MGSGGFGGNELLSQAARRPAVADNRQIEITLRHFMETLSFLFSKITFLDFDLTFCFSPFFNYR